MYFLLYIFFAFQVPFNALEVIHTVFILKVLTFKLKKNISFSILQWNNSFWFRLCKIGYLAHFYFLLFFTSHSLPLPAWFCPCNLVFSTLIIPLGKSNFFSYIMYFLLGELFLDIQINSIFFYALIFLCHDFLLYSWVLIQQYMYEQFLLSEQITWVVSFFAPFISRYLFLSPSQLHDNLAEYRILKLQTSSEFCRIYFIDLYFTELYNSEASLSLAPLDIIWVCSCFVCYFSLIGFSKVFILYPWNIEIRHLASLDVYFFSFILPARLSLRRII